VRPSLRKGPAAGAWSLWLVHEVRHEEEWPLQQTRRTDLHLRADGRLTDALATGSETVGFDIKSGRDGFTWEVGAGTEITGPMALRLFLEVERAEDMYFFVGIQKLRAGRVVPFEGSYGYGFDRVATGWLKASLRKGTPSTRSRGRHTTPTTRSCR